MIRYATSSFATVGSNRITTVRLSVTWGPAREPGTCAATIRVPSSSSQDTIRAGRPSIVSWLDR